VSLNVNPSQIHCISPAKTEGKSRNVGDFKDSLKRFDKRELFQSNSSSEIEMYGSEKLIKKKETLVHDNNHSLMNTSIDSNFESPTNKKYFAKNGLMREKYGKSFNFLRNDNIIVPIEEVKKLEDLQTPKIMIERMNKKSTLKGQQAGNQFSVLDEGSKMLKEYLSQIKQEIGDDEKNKNNISKMSDSLEFAVVRNSSGKKSIEEDDIFAIKKFK